MSAARRPGNNRGGKPASQRGPKGAATRSAGPKGAAPRSAGPKGAASRSAKPTRGARTTAPPARQVREKGLGGAQVEGRQAVRELLLSGARRIHEVFIANDMDHAEVLDDIAELAHDLKVPVREVTRRQLDVVSRTEASQGVVARAAELVDVDLDELCTPAPNRPAPFLVALDGVTDPGNLGALIRTAECAGVTGVVLPKHRAVHVTPTVTKAAAGAVEYVPMALVGGLPAAITAMRARGVWVVGLDAGGDESIHALRLGDEPVCLVLGAEGAGLSRLVRERCDVVASIPMAGRLGSLNVSVAGALAIYEIVRRRS